MAKSSLFVLFILGVASCFYFFQPKTVSVIGSWTITESDVQQRNAIDLIFFPQSGGTGGLVQLEQSARYLQVLEKNGVTVSDDDLTTEAQRIESESKDRSLLQKIKDVFHGDQKAYLKNYVKPTLLDRIVPFEFFPNNVEIHKESYSKALEFQALAKSSPKSFRDLALSKGFVVRRFLADKKMGIKWLSVKMRSLRSLSP